MTNKRFNEIKESWYRSQDDTLDIKGDDYATEDRLHNFKAIAELTGLTPLQACMVLRAKHTVALYEKVFKGEPISPGFFDEKAGDDANYLVLAKALYEEQEDMEIINNRFKFNSKEGSFSYWSEEKQCWFDNIEKTIDGYYDMMNKNPEDNPLYMTEKEEKYVPLGLCWTDFPMKERLKEMEEKRTKMEREDNLLFVSEMEDIENLPYHWVETEGEKGEVMNGNSPFYDQIFKNAKTMSDKKSTETEGEK